MTSVSKIEYNNKAKQQVLNTKQIRDLLEQYFMGDDDMQQFFQETPKEQYTAHDVLTWLGC